MDPSISTLLLLIILVLLSAFFSGAETALISLTPAKVQAMLQNKERGAKWIAYLKGKPQKMLLIILVYINFVNVGASALATVYFTTISGSYGAGIATGVMTLSLLVFGEVLPKSFANKNPVRFSQFVAYPLVILEYIAYPIIWVFEKALKTIVGDHIHTVSEDEVIAMVSMGAQEGSIHKHEKELIENVLEFNDISVEDIMTPRTQLFALEDTITVQEAIKEAAEAAHSRIPVYHEDLDHIIGFITGKKLLSLSMEPKMLGKTLNEIELYEFIKVPATRKIYSLFVEFKRKRTHIALIFDEHGGTEGIVTMEDILEEIVGEITDETDEEEVEDIKVLDSNTLLLTANAEIGDIERILGIEIPDYDNVDQINWVILDHLKRFPKKNEAITIGGAKFEVVSMDDVSNKILTLKAYKIFNPHPDPDA